MENEFKTTEELHRELMEAVNKYYANLTHDDVKVTTQDRHNITLQLIEFAKRNLPLDVKNIKPLPYEYGAVRFEFEFDNYIYIFKFYLYNKNYTVQICEHEPDHYGRILGKCVSEKLLKIFLNFSFPNPKKYVKGDFVMYLGNCYTIKNYYYDDHSIRYELEFHTGRKTWAAESQLKKFQSGL